MRKLKEIKEQIEATRKIIDNKDFYDNEDKWGAFGYLHGLLYVTGKLQAKIKLRYGFK